MWLTKEAAAAVFTQQSADDDDEQTEREVAQDTVGENAKEMRLSSPAPIADPQSTSKLKVELAALRSKNTELLQLIRAQSQLLGKMEQRQRLAVLEEQGIDRV